MNHTTVINKISDLGYKGFKEAYLRQLECVYRRTWSPKSETLGQFI